jgi:hypothetical protein
LIEHEARLWREKEKSMMNEKIRKNKIGVMITPTEGKTPHRFNAEQIHHVLIV